MAGSSDDTFEYVFVDDGSRDRSRQIILELAERSDCVRYVLFSRNFGHEAATTAGTDHASGEAVVIIDADLQDPPEVILDLVGRWREGADVVYAQRKVRQGETVFKRFSSWLFYRLISWLSNVNIPVDTGDFRLMDRKVVEHFRRCREQNRFVRGLVAWTGFKQVAHPYERDQRHGGETKYNVFKLVPLAFDAVLSFSDVPLRLGVYVGLFVCLAALALGVVEVIQKLFFGIQQTGYAFIATGIFFLGGVKIFMVGLMGEYVGRIYRQTQQRPLYIVEDKHPGLPAGYQGWFHHGDRSARTQDSE